jgi:hypothetical protein
MEVGEGFARAAHRARETCLNGKQGIKKRSIEQGESRDEAMS